MPSPYARRRVAPQCRRNSDDGDYHDAPLPVPRAVVAQNDGETNDPSSSSSAKANKALTTTAVWVRTSALDAALNHPLALSTSRAAAVAPGAVASPSPTSQFHRRSGGRVSSLLSSGSLGGSTSSLRQSYSEMNIGGTGGTSTGGGSRTPSNDSIDINEGGRGACPPSPSPTSVSSASSSDGTSGGASGSNAVAAANARVTSSSRALSTNWGWARAELLDASGGGGRSIASSPTNISSPQSRGSDAYTFPSDTKSDIGNEEATTTSAKCAAITVRVSDSESEYDSLTVSLPGDALRVGDVVMANVYRYKWRRTATTKPSATANNSPCRYDAEEQGAEEQEQEPPDDLITLTHLHEPALIDALRCRYASDEIYTATGPVLLALNPFKPCRSLYDEGTMQMYWDAAERKKRAEAQDALNNAHAHTHTRKHEHDQPEASAKGNEMGKGGGVRTKMVSETGINGSGNRRRKEELKLPPHVYGIADISFRTMIRHLDDNIINGKAPAAAATQPTNEMDEAAVGKLPPATATGGAAEKNTPSAPSNKVSCDQSILVSGESGAGKTVTTKFIMKYLAALSQRSAEEACRKALLIKQEKERMDTKQRIIHGTGRRRGRGRSPPRRSSSQPSWAIGARQLKPVSANNKKIFCSSPSRNDGDDDPCSSPTRSQIPTNSIEQQVLQSNPILESFGNARTVRNDNSSRFGKFIEIKFTLKGTLVGALIETYLLEKVRLVRQGNGERNYHVFYEVLQGMDRREADRLRLTGLGPTDFQMTCKSGTYDRRDGVKDRDTYRSLRSAMDTMGFLSGEQQNIFTVTAALLHLGNMTLKETDENEEMSEVDYQNPHLGPVCDLLGITPESLTDALCYFSIQAGRSREGSVRRSLSREKAEKGLEALIKATYGAMFWYLVGRINESIAARKGDCRSPNELSEAASAMGEGDRTHRIDDASDSSYGASGTEDNMKASLEEAAAAASISVLDIFGFESFKTNSFEQLCINYCNEALQQQFNAFVLKNEQEEYEREGIEWSFIKFPENQDVLDLIDKRGLGILNILDDQCRAPGTSDRSFAADLYAKCSGHVRFEADRRQISGNRFVLRHYAGAVEYTAEGFVEKNRDELPKEASELLRSSSNAFVNRLADIIVTSALSSSSGPATVGAGGAAATAGRGGGSVYALRRTNSSVSRTTVGGQFSRQLRDLRRKIDQTCPHYIRCLKPNDCLIPDRFDPAVVAEQLRCCGILEAVRVSRAGYTQHYSHGEFVRRYGMLGRAKQRGEITGGNDLGARTWNGSSGFIRGGIVSSRSGNFFRGGRSKFDNGRSQRGTTNRNTGRPAKMSFSSSKDECDALVRVIYRKMKEMEAEEVEAETTASGPVDLSTLDEPRSFLSYSSHPQMRQQPKWSGNVMASKLHVDSHKSSQASQRNGSMSPPPPAKSLTRPWPPPSAEMTDADASYRPGTARPFCAATASPSRPNLRASAPSGSDLRDMGIQMGKSKVFLRHAAFDKIERLRSRVYAAAATIINAAARMLLARVAYIPVRDAYREELQERGGISLEGQNRFKYESVQVDGGIMPGDANDLIRKFESDVRIGLHGPGIVGNRKWQRTVKSFKWLLVEGRWVKNLDFMDDVPKSL